MSRTWKLDSFGEMLFNSIPSLVCPEVGYLRLEQRLGTVGNYQPGQSMGTSIHLPAPQSWLINVLHGVCWIYTKTEMF